MQEQEFKKIYSEYGRSLYNFALWITANRSMCEDIIQEVFIKIWRCKTVPSDECELKRWLLTVTRHTCLDFLRKSSRFIRFQNHYKSERFDYHRDVDASFIWEELRNLPETERSILYLHIKIGFNYGEIAKLLEMTENYVRVRAFRAFKRLRETLIKKEI